MKVLFKADLDDEVNNLIAKRLFGEEERDLARVCLACLLLGVNKKKVRKVADCDKFEEYWKNLEEAHYFSDDQKIDIEPLETDVPFVLMMKCAKGTLLRKSS